MSTFHEYLRGRLETGGFSTEDTLASFLPLVREVLDAHAAGCVAPLEGLDALKADGARIWFEEARRLEPRGNAAAVRTMESTAAFAVTVVTETRCTTEVGEGDALVVDMSIGDDTTELTRPIYLPGYVTWEHKVGHHDPLTDVFSLGMILASLACGLDFAEPESLRAFVAHRRNLFTVNPALHPVLAQAISRMTELDRHARVQDLRALLHNLENYRDQEIDFDVDLARIPGFVEKDRHDKQYVVLSKLRERLFEISKRNRLLYFRPTMQTVNLTHASIPLSFDIKNIRPDQVLVWNDSLHAALCGEGEPISLNKYLNFAEALYLPSMLDRIIAESNRDQAEFGFGQLRLVICFLHWANLKEKPVERLDSPLVLLPVELKKKKGIRDTYYLAASSTEAEVNPALRYQFQQLYGISLPEVIDLSTTNLDQFFQYLSQRIVASEPAVTLTRIDRPRIALIHDKARRKLDQYRRQARLAGRAVRSFLNLDYSYDAVNYHPLGITLFSARVRPVATHLRTIIEEKPRPGSFATPEPESPAAEKERLLYHLEDGGEENPYRWNFDLCSVTLGNFKYRKMSLVRDYEVLLADPASNLAFDATFSLTPRPAERPLPPPVAIEDRFHVVSSDPTQASAIEEARTGRSYIVQGPPGTGKSQTITNLIADYVARGKRVLFVCEKRAAIDVVYARLRHCGLGELCSLIHDSQIDKKGFVMDLKQTYEALLADGIGDSPTRGRIRKELLQQMKANLLPLEQFDAAMQKIPHYAGIPLRQLLRRCVELRERVPEMSALEKERLPTYSSWWQNRDRIASLSAVIQDIRSDGTLAKHPLSRLSPRIGHCEHPMELVVGACEAAERHFRAIDHTLGRCGVPKDQWRTLSLAKLLVEYAKLVFPLTRLDKLNLLDAARVEASRFADVQRQFEGQHEVVAAARQATKAWRQKLAAADLSVALEQAALLERSYFAWLRPGWWRLRRVLNKSYDFSAHVEKPRWTRVLATLQDEYAQLAELEDLRKTIAEELGVVNDVDGLLGHVREVRRTLPKMPAWLGRIHAALLKAEKSPQIVSRIVESEQPLCLLAVELARVLPPQHVEKPLEELRVGLKEIAAVLDDLPTYLQCVAEVAVLPDTLATALRTLPLALDQIEAATADHCLATAYRDARQLASFTGAVRSRHVQHLERIYGRWLASNAEEVRQGVKERFVHNVRLAGLPAAQLSEDERERKKRYNRGRRDLEHEFGKSMRFKSIRDLVSSDSGEVIKDLKPVWLMSPLSVSDTLPMDDKYFDVVIFDEASQITLEEAVPSLFRANQAIVVGDEMQLPPTDFFSARPTTGDELELLIEEGGEVIQYDLASNSFLNHAAKNLPSTMLGWHYRSRSESLISFSNWAFYDGRLLTVPEERLPSPSREPLVISKTGDAEQGAAILLNRSVSCHRLPHGVYDKRRNQAEADYIAHLVRELFRCQNGRSIGIVAFSEAQQDEIEGALARLAQEDAVFRDRLDAEWEREVDGQFVGLLVKNLENIQGDERDIIVLSVCYGFGPNGKMLMNFGPINKSGGERRLNVAFSRAKHHMAVVSSIQSTDITNEYNDGANCLKNYLRYAEAVSLGNGEATQRILHGMSRWQGAVEGPSGERDPVAEQMSSALEERGFVVDRAVGQSHFRCDLAVRCQGDGAYRLGILLDNDSYFDQSDPLERDLMRPKLLREFGWKVAFVLAKDWYEDRCAVLDRLCRLLAGEVEPTAFGVETGLAGAKAVDAADLSQDPTVTTDGEEKAPAAATVESDAREAASESPLSPTAIAKDVPLADLAGPSDATSLERYTLRLEFRGGGSSKFWEITLAGVQHTVRFGRIGTRGQSVTKTFESAVASRRDRDRLVRSKKAKRLPLGSMKDNRTRRSAACRPA